MMVKVGFIGLGNIGFPMAKNIVEGGFETIVFDLSEAPANRLAELGAAVASAPAEVANKADIIGICVRDDNDVDNLLYGEYGLLQNGKAGAIIAIHSTVTQASVLCWAEDAEKYHMHIVDAPITGGAHGAEEKTLCYMLGGDSQLLKRLEPVINTSAKKVVYAGDTGSGIALKLCNNMINYSAFAAIDEAVRLAEACHLDPELVYQVGEANGIVTDLMKRFISGREGLKPVLSDDEFDQVFGPFERLAEKDLDAALQTAANKQLSLPATEKLREIIYNVFYKTDGN